MMDDYEHLSLVSETSDHVTNYLIVAGDNQNISDITIYCKDKSIRACKMILASVSQMLYELLKEDSQTSAIFASDILSTSLHSWLFDVYRKKDIRKYVDINALFQVQVNKIGVKNEPLDDKLLIKQEQQDLDIVKDTRFDSKDGMIVGFPKIENSRYPPPYENYANNTRRSHVWDHFVKLEEFLAKCIHCHEESPLSMSRSTSPMWTHLNKCQSKEVVCCYECNSKKIVKRGFAVLK